MEKRTLYSHLELDRILAERKMSHITHSQIERFDLGDKLEVIYFDTKEKGVTTEKVTIVELGNYVEGVGRGQVMVEKEDGSKMNLANLSERNNVFGYKVLGHPLREPSNQKN